MEPHMRLLAALFRNLTLWAKVYLAAKVYTAATVPICILTALNRFNAWLLWSRLNSLLPLCITVCDKISHPYAGPCSAISI